MMKNTGDRDRGSGVRRQATDNFFSPFALNLELFTFYLLLLTFNF